MLSLEDLERRIREGWSKFDILVEAAVVALAKEKGETLERQRDEEHDDPTKEQHTGKQRNDDSFKNNALMFGSYSRSPKSVLPQHCPSKKPDGIAGQARGGILFWGANSRMEAVKFGPALPTLPAFGLSRASSSTDGLMNSLNGRYVHKKLLASEPLMMPTMKGRKTCAGESLINRKKEAKKPKLVNNSQYAPVLNESFQSIIDAMGGTDVKFVIEKKLFMSDLDIGQARLSMPLSKIKSDFLKKSEKETMENFDSDKKHWKEVAVVLIEPNLHMSTVGLKKWKYTDKKNEKKTSSSYVLTGKKSWVEVHRRSELKVNDVLHVWSFRKGMDLCLALVCKNRDIKTCDKDGCSCKAGNFQA